jgi:hypothetical protein
MHILFIIAIGALAAGFFLSRQLRNTVLNLAQTGWIVLWGELRKNARVVLGAVIGSLLIFVGIMTIIGASLNAPYAGFLIGLLFPAWVFFYIFRLGRFGTIARWTTGPVLIVAMLLFFFGALSPDMKAAYDRRADNAKFDAATAMNNESLHSTKESGNFRGVRESCALLNEAGQPIAKVEKGKIVMATGRIMPATKNSEGMAEVILQNDLNRYNGKVGFVPSRILVNQKWKDNEKEKAEIVLAQSVPAIQNVQQVQQLVTNTAPACQDKYLGLWHGKIAGKAGTMPVRVTQKCDGRIVMNQVQFGNVVITLNKNDSSYAGDWMSNDARHIVGKIRLNEKFAGKIENGGGKWCPITFYRG